MFEKAIKSQVSGSKTIKPEYTGSGLLVLEPTYKFLILEDLSNWGGEICLDDGLFLACDSNIKQKITARTNVSSAVLGKEGFFNLALFGSGTFCLKSSYPIEELIKVNLQDDVIKIDGNLAIAWSTSLKFTVERSSKTLIGSAVSGEGFVNVYRGTGSVLMKPFN